MHQQFVILLLIHGFLPVNGRLLIAFGTFFYAITLIIAEKAVPKAINSCALTSQKPCINKEFHVSLMHRFLTFHMQDSGQYSISTEAASSLHLKLSIK